MKLTPLTDEELIELNKKAEQAEEERSRSKKRAKITSEKIIDIMALHLQTDAKQTLIAKLVGTNQATVSIYTKWISEVLP